MKDTVRVRVSVGEHKSGVIVKMGGYIMELAETPALMDAINETIENAFLNGAGDGVPVGILSIK